MDNLNKQQQQAVDKLLSSFFNEKRDYFVLSGVSGSGKTHVIGYLYENFKSLGKSVRICSLTGKAVINIINRFKFPNSEVGTLHHFFTHTKLNDEGEEIEEVKFEFLTDEQFELNFNNTVFIIDEASMVPQKFLDYLFDKSGIKIIFVGDKEQLGPVNSEDINIMKFYDYHLEEIERTDNDIVLLSAHIRKYGTIPLDFESPDVDIIKRSEPSITWFENNIDNFDIVICGTNKNKNKFNSMIREVLGYSHHMPEVGETVICRQNATDLSKNKKRIFNGELFTVHSVKHFGSFSKYVLKSNNDGGFYHVKLRHKVWQDKNKIIPKQNKCDSFLFTFDYGYAITCHSSQGSEWNNVVFIDEDVGFFIPIKAFRYTGITRTVKKVYIFTNNRK